MYLTFLYASYSHVTHGNLYIFRPYSIVREKVQQLVIMGFPIGDLFIIGSFLLTILQTF